MGLSPSPLDALRGRRVLVTGHTGFKGSWLSIWLHRLGAQVTGVALPPEPDGLFVAAGVRECLHAHHEEDVRDRDAVARVLTSSKPDLVFHLAAQSLVRVSYDEPLETFATNALGTVNLLEAVRATASADHPCAVVCVTTDKCYRNDELGEPLREQDPLGGHDPYSASKAMAELATHSYRASFFPTARIRQHGVRLASARAGNVVGGGDLARDRIVPDLVRACVEGTPLTVRNPDSVRPWQHVLDPLHGYLQLALRLAGDNPEPACDAFNFGPDLDGCTTVRALIESIGPRLSSQFEYTTPASSDHDAKHEAKLLRLATDKAHTTLGWRPVWNFLHTAKQTGSWYADSMRGGFRAGDRCREDIALFEQTAQDPDSLSARSSTNGE